MATSPPQTDGSVVFARFRQCALPSGYIGATWLIRLNLCFLRPTRVHNPNGKSIGSAIFAQLTAKCRRGEIFLSHNNCPFACRIRAPYITCFLGPTRLHNPNGISIGSAVFAQFTPVSSGMSGRALPPQNCPFPWLCGSVPSSNTWFLGFTRLSIPNGISIGSAVFGRPFVKRFALCYQTVVCLSVGLSVCLSCL